MKFCSVAIDGPAGAGKSTIAKGAAAALGMVYVDTGAMYRAMAYYFLQHDIAADDRASIIAALDSIDITIEYREGVQHVILNGEDVNGYIRTEQVSQAASAFSVVAEVRKKLVELQRELARKADVIMDGRDIASVVLPDADLKIYLTASVETRADRRYREHLAKGTKCIYADIVKEIEERDYRDMHRDNSPLVRVPEAELLDTSDMTADEVVAYLIRRIKEVKGL